MAGLASAQITVHYSPEELVLTVQAGVRLADPARLGDTSGLDGSTAGLLARLGAHG